ncbi:hypothetical protein F7725_017305 [Dissostichus mawsoni]|uniref:Uncharacterized protein n=1 Tax=Dissostichus mawsoni TaxID=36200 RepID=A0A7J5Z426_DISMA|nr:hypothetical protein F7725_017305 [Dissostichus mawsoni]
MRGGREQSKKAPAHYLQLLRCAVWAHADTERMQRGSVVIVTIVYQKEAGMLVNLLELEPFSA